MEGDMGKAVLEKPFTLSELAANWKAAILTCNLPKESRMDWLSKWIILTRGCVFSMTLTSGLVGGLLAGATASTTGNFNWVNFILSVVGLLFAHATNNLINDYFDFEVGVDGSDNYARAQYAPHPIISGMVTKAHLRNVILGLNLLDAIIMVYLTIVVGWPVLIFALAGLFVSVFYVAPPIRLKKIGLGELGVVLVWGPLMIGGTYYVTVGSIEPWVLIASLPYAFLVGTVLMGKHIDKAPQDKPMKTYTLPVVVGHDASIRINQVISVLFFVAIIGLVVAGSMTPWMLVALFAIPKLITTLKTYSAPKPEEFKDRPLYYVGIAFFFTRTAGFWLMVGLLLNLLFPFPVKLPTLF